MVNFQVLYTFFTTKAEGIKALGYVKSRARLKKLSDGPRAQSLKAIRESEKKILERYESEIPISEENNKTIALAEIYWDLYQKSSRFFDNSPRGMLRDFVLSLKTLLEDPSLRHVTEHRADFLKLKSAAGEIPENILALEEKITALLPRLRPGKNTEEISQEVMRLIGEFRAEELKAIGETFDSLLKSRGLPPLPKALSK